MDVVDVDEVVEDVEDVVGVQEARTVETGTLVTSRVVTRLSTGTRIVLLSVREQRSALCQPAAPSRRTPAPSLPVPLRRLT